MASLYHKIRTTNLLLSCWSASAQRKKSSSSRARSSGIRRNPSSSVVRITLIISKLENWWSRWRTGISKNSPAVGVCAALESCATTVTVLILIPLISLILRGYWILKISKKIPVLFYKKYAKANAMQEAQSIVSIKVRCCTANFVLI